MVRSSQTEFNTATTATCIQDAPSGSFLIVPDLASLDAAKALLDELHRTDIRVFTVAVLDEPGWFRGRTLPGLVVDPAVPMGLSREAALRMALRTVAKAAGQGEGGQPASG